MTRQLPADPHTKPSKKRAERVTTAGFRVNTWTDGQTDMTKSRRGCAPQIQPVRELPPPVGPTPSGEGIHVHHVRCIVLCVYTHYTYRYCGTTSSGEDVQGVVLCSTIHIHIPVLRSHQHVSCSNMHVCLCWLMAAATQACSAMHLRLVPAPSSCTHHPC